MAIDFKRLSPKRINQNNHLSTGVYTTQCFNVFIQNEYIVADWRIGWISSFREMNDAARIEIKCGVNMINELRVMATRNRSHKIQSEKDNLMWYQKRLLHTHTVAIKPCETVILITESCVSDYVHVRHT